MNNLVQHKLWAKQGFFCSINVYCFFNVLFTNNMEFLGLMIQSSTKLESSSAANIMGTRKGQAFGASQHVPVGNTILHI